MNNRYRRVIRTFIHRIDKLQSYVDNVLGQFIEEMESEESSKYLIPFALLRDANLEKGDEDKFTKKEIANLEKKFGRKNHNL